MATEEEALQPDEVQAEAKAKRSEDAAKDAKLRTVLGDVYTFVRSQEINRTIASFTLDHYIDEAKRKLKGTGRSIRDASGQSLGLRPAQLEALTALEQDFVSSLEEAKKKAASADSAG